MHDNWLTARPHMSSLALKMRALLELADAMWTEGRTNGGDVDYARFEEDVARRTAEVECAVHEVALSGLDVDAPFVTVWGKTYRRVHPDKTSHTAWSDREKHGDHGGGSAFYSTIAHIYNHTRNEGCGSGYAHDCTAKSQ